MEKTKIAILKNPVPKFCSDYEKLTALGSNTGNLVFWEALGRLFKPDFLPYVEKDQLCNYDKAILTDLIWIRENATFEYIDPILEKHQIPFIPISVGLQSKTFNPDFKLHPDTVKLLQKMQERALLGVRGYYTAEILNKYGIKNISIIGCPSMYYWNNPNLKIEGTPKKGQASSNFKTFHGMLSARQEDFLCYCAKHNMQFVEQTEFNLKPEMANSQKSFKLLDKWFSSSRDMFYDHESWSFALNNITFSLGGRFHGNVIALHNNIKSLFLTSDSRTQELTDFFKLPSIPFEKFDARKPLEYYYELADYSRFNSNYACLYENFSNFASKNGIEFSREALPLSFEIGQKRVGKDAFIESEILSKISKLDVKQKKLLLSYLSSLDK